MKPIQNRYDFVYLFDVADGNPNGDPDAGNLPRLDPENNRGLVSDVCLKRKIRNYVSAAKPDSSGYEIYVVEKAVLNDQQHRAYKAIGIKSVSKKLPKDKQKAKEITDWMCKNFYDIRTFGAVMTTEVNCGQVRGPVQLCFARSVEPVLPLEISITRMAVTKVEDAEKKPPFGKKHIVPYGLYRTHGFISAHLANQTGFSEDDLELLQEALEQMFEHDRAAARGEMNARKLVLFKHDNRLGNAPAYKLFERVSIKRVSEGNEYKPGEGSTHSLPPARDYNDYRIDIDEKNLPKGVQIIDKI